MSIGSAPAQDPSQPRRRRTRKALNCEPCRLHKLKCNRARPCSACVYRGTQSLCFPGVPEPKQKQGTAVNPAARQIPKAPSHHQKGPLHNPLGELGHMQASLTTIRRYWGSQKRQREQPSPAEHLPIYQDVLLESETIESLLIGPSHASAQFLNMFQGLHPSPSGSYMPFRESTNIPHPSKDLYSPDLVPLLPPHSALETLLSIYVNSGTWIHRYVDEVDLQDKIDRWVKHTETDDITLALFFALSAVAVHYLPWDHKIRRIWPEDVPATGARFHDIAMLILERSHETLMEYPTLELLELYLVLGHYHATVRSADSGEALWSINHKLLGLALAMGLNRDPGTWDLPETAIAKRRWIWWNILSFERWTCVLLGRPPTILNSDFDTRYPIPEPSQPQEAADNLYMPYLATFRYTHFLGPMLHDIHDLQNKMHLDKVTAHDRALHQWRANWPPDLALSEYDFAFSLSRINPEDVQRRGMQSMHLIVLFHYTRFVLFRPTRLPVTHSVVADSASLLVSIISRAIPEYRTNPKLTVSGHSGVGPYGIFLAGVFYTYQLLADPKQPGSAHLALNLSEAIKVALDAAPLPTAARCAKLLGPTSPFSVGISSPMPGTVPMPGDSTVLDEAAKYRNALRIAALRRMTFPYLGVAEVSDVEDLYPTAESPAPESDGEETGTGTGTADRDSMSLRAFSEHHS